MMRRGLRLALWAVAGWSGSGCERHFVQLGLSDARSADVDAGPAPNEVCDDSRPTAFEYGNDAGSSAVALLGPGRIFLASTGPNAVYKAIGPGGELSPITGPGADFAPSSAFAEQEGDRIWIGGADGRIAALNVHSLSSTVYRGSAQGDLRWLSGSPKGDPAELYAATAVLGTSSVATLWRASCEQGACSFSQLYARTSTLYNRGDPEEQADPDGKNSGAAAWVAAGEAFLEPGDSHCNRASRCVLHVVGNSVEEEPIESYIDGPTRMDDGVTALAVVPGLGAFAGTKWGRLLERDRSGFWKEVDRSLIGSGKPGIGTILPYRGTGLFFFSGQLGVQWFPDRSCYEGHKIPLKPGTAPIFDSVLGAAGSSAGWVVVGAPYGMFDTQGQFLYLTPLR